MCSESAVVLELVSLSTFANGFSPHISTFSHFLCSILSFFFLIITIPMMTGVVGKGVKLAPSDRHCLTLRSWPPRHLRSQLSLATVATVALRAKSNVTEIFATYHLKCLQNKLNIFDLGLSRQLRSELIFFIRLTFPCLNDWTSVQFCEQPVGLFNLFNARPLTWSMLARTAVVNIGRVGNATNIVQLLLSDLVLEI